MIYAWGYNYVEYTFFCFANQLWKSQLALATFDVHANMLNNNKPLALELLSDNCEIKYSGFVYNFETLKYCYVKSICSIFLKLTAFNKNTRSNSYINFLRDQMSFNVNINFPNID